MRIVTWFKFKEENFEEVYPFWNNLLGPEGVQVGLYWGPKYQDRISLDFLTSKTYTSSIIAFKSFPLGQSINLTPSQFSGCKWEGKKQWDKEVAKLIWSTCSIDFIGSFPEEMIFYGDPLKRPLNSINNFWICAKESDIYNILPSQ